MNAALEKRKNEARLKSPWALWERWGYVCERASMNEFRIYPAYGKKEGEDDGRRTKTRLPHSCLYRSHRGNDGVWRTHKVDCGKIYYHEVPGNEDVIKQYGKKIDYDPIVSDNISLCEAFERKTLKEAGKPYHGFGFMEALNLVHAVCGGETANQRHAGKKVAEEQTSPEDSAMLINFLRKCGSMKSQGAAHARQYLRNRGISDEVIDLFAREKILFFSPRRADFQESLVFVGWEIKRTAGMDEKRPALIARRLTGGSLIGDGPSNKKNVRGSKKKWVPIFEGRGAAIFVEGGVDMLSIAEICAQNGGEIPSIIATCGAPSMDMWENENLKKIVRDCGRAVFVSDNDFHLDEKARAGKRENLETHLRMAESLGARGKIIYPDPECNDSNDMLMSKNASRLAEFHEKLLPAPYPPQKKPTLS